MDTPSAAEDAVVVRSLHPDGSVLERLRVAVPAGVQAVAVCPPEDAGMAPLVVGVGGGLWIVR